MRNQFLNVERPYELTVSETGEVNVISSLEVAEMVGREHKNVVRDIEKIKEDLGKLNFEHTPYFAETTYEHPQNKQHYKMFLLTKKRLRIIRQPHDRNRGYGIHSKVYRAF